MDVNGVSLKTLFDAIIVACREAADGLPHFEDNDGAIRITFLPQNEFGRELQCAMSNQASRCEVVAKISEDGNFVQNRPTEPTDTYSTTAMKVASHLRDQEIGSKNDKCRDEKHGFTSSRGVLSFKLLYDHAMFGLLLVSIDVGLPVWNEIVVSASKEAVRSWCQMGPKEDGHSRMAYIPN